MTAMKIFFIICINCPLLFSSVAVTAAPITFNTALPVAKGQFLLREQLILNRSGNDPSAANRQRNENALVTTLGYSFTPRWAAFISLPYRDIQLNLDMSGQGISRQNKGWGDLNAFLRYTAYQYDQPGQTFRLAPFFGLKAPTAETQVRDERGILPPPVQRSSGSWDYFGGFVITWQTLTRQLDMQLSYRATNEANGFEAGNSFSVNASYQHRLWYSQNTALPDYLYGVLEVNLLNQQENRVNGIKDPNSNGKRLFFSPGIQYVNKRWIFETAIQVPVSQQLNGQALENDYVLRAGFRVNL